MPASVRRELGSPPAARRAPFDFVHWFVRDRTELVKRFGEMKKKLAKTGMLWVSWRKGGMKAKPPCDVDENIVRDEALAGGLVDVKVCAVDETWSGLKLVYRLKDR
jgi:hypothetical protein